MEERREKISNTRKIIGERLRYSMQTFPQLQWVCKVDMTDLLALKNEMKARGEAASMAAFFVKATAATLMEFPDLNTRAEGDEIIYYENVNVGIAMNTSKGLMVPVIKNAQQKKILEIDEEIKRFHERIESNKAIMDDFIGGTVTVSSVLNNKAEWFNSIITDNECLIIGFAGTRKDIMIDKMGQPVVKDMMPVCINWNHWITDGVPTSNFVLRFCEIIEDAKNNL